MADPNATPSADPADQDSATGMLKVVLRKFLQGTDDMLPARVTAYDRTTNRATVQPLVAMLTTAGVRVERATIASVPVFQYGGGDLLLSFPINVGDLGWIKANDRDISMVLQTWSAGPPNTRRMHSFEDCMFFPDAMRGYSILGEDASAAVLQTKDGSARVSVKAGQVKMTAGASNITITPAGVAINGASV